MLKGKNKLLTIGVLLNSINATLGLMTIIYLFLGFVGYDYSNLKNLMVTEEMLATASLSIWLDVTISITTIFLILSGIFSTIGYIKKNNDFVLTAIVLLVISLILDIVLGLCLPIFLTISIIISIILIIIGYIQESKSAKNK